MTNRGAHEFDEENLIRGALEAARSPSFPAAFERRLRFDELDLWIWPGAGALEDDPAFRSTLSVISELAAHPAIQMLLLPLAAGETDIGLVADPTAAFAPRKRPGTKRREGSWPLIYLAFAHSGETKLQSWYGKTETALLWPLCGFGDWIPDQNTVEERFKELRSQWKVFAAFGRWLVQNARCHVPWLGKIVVVDGHLFASPAELVHACRDPEACEKAGWVGRTLKSDPADQLTRARAEENQLLAEDDRTLSQAPLTRGARVYLNDPHTGFKGWYRWFFIPRTRCRWLAVGAAVGPLPQRSAVTSSS